MLISDRVGGLRPSDRRGLLPRTPRADIHKPERATRAPKISDDSRRRHGKEATDAQVAETDPKKLESSGDKFVAQYIFFLKSLAEQSYTQGQSPAVDPDKLQEDLSELETRLAPGAGVPASDATEAVRLENIEAFSFSAQIEYSEARVATLVQDSSGAAFAASFEAHLKASFEGQVTFKDGSTLSVSASIEVDISASIAAAISAAEQAQQPQRSDPLALDIDGDGAISVVGPESGALFDINADGALDRSSFVSGSDVFLALDRNANGSIDNGGELFGDQHGLANGFLELGRFDDDQNGLIDARDSVFNSLRGVNLSADGSLVSRTLAELGVSSIGLGYQDISQLINGNNMLTQIGSYRTNSGEERRAYDVGLSYQPISQRV